MGAGARRGSASGMIAVGLGLMAAASVSFLVTWLTRRYALRRDLLDIPNERSSHSVPTPRGGGVAIVVTVLGGMLLFWTVGLVAGRDLAGIGLGGLLVAVVGFVDDHRDLTPHVRASVHAVAALWALVWVGAPTSVDLGLAVVPLGWAGPGLALIGIVWLTNLYNFMDGIDGLAASEAVLAGSIGGALLLLTESTSLAFVALLVAAAALGFFVWNRPPAKIFMGDVGSGFLGFVFGVLSISGPGRDGVPILAWILILGVFFGDATITLARRAMAGERWHRPHRDHAYQRMAQAGWSHGRVSGTAGLITVSLGGLAASCVFWPRMTGILFIVGVWALAGVYRAVERKKAPAFGTRS